MMKTKKRRSIRLKGYDYAKEGAYFITICVQGRKCLFGKIVENEMALTSAGEMVVKAWREISAKYNGVETDQFICMPNHIHGIIMLKPNEGQTNLRLFDVLQRFKSWTTTQYRKGVQNHNWPRFDARLWQRNYYEHIIRDEDELNQIREYISCNPVQWNSDEYNPHLN